MPDINKLEANFGVEVVGLDLSRDLNDNTMKLLTQALYENQVMVIRDQTLDRDDYLAFGRQWGSPIPHVLDHMHMQGYPEMMTVGNTEKRDRDDKIRNGAALWHTDQSYEAVPASATMLYSLKAPRIGGETQFCNMALAYEALDESTRASISGLEMAHKYGYGKVREGEQSANPIINDEQDNRVPPVYHPIVMAHPVSGRNALYALGHGAHGIKGMDTAVADSLIERLKDHVLEERFIYRHAYAVGDLVVWDTMATMHCATMIDTPDAEVDERLLWRISVRNKPGIYA